jgi:Queuosine biosynthesis protein QueC
MAQPKEVSIQIPSIAVDVVEAGAHPRKGSLQCQIGENIDFNIEHLESYCFAAWEPVVYDALLIAAAVEFADRTKRRQALTWHRGIDLRIPVHDPARWKDKAVADSLVDALGFLTGDYWRLEFYKRRRSLSPPRQGRFSLPGGSVAVIPFSDGLDSRAVAGLMGREIGDKLIRVRLGSKGFDGLASRRQPFTSVPYKVRAGNDPFVESSARSRGFKFALISGLAAYLAKAGQVIVPESGQGSLGPALVTVGQAYEDYRSHPLFTDRMEKFLHALLGYRVRFHFPRLWYTKAETLRKFVDECEDGPLWSDTWSCWQQNRQVSVDGTKRHCGVCAACMLRRLSVHAAGLSEPRDRYVWENLGAPTFRGGAAASFEGRKITTKLNHLAGLRSSPANVRMLNLSAFQLGKSLGLPQTDVRGKLDRLLAQHESEWKSFMGSLGPSSFVANWTVQAS